MDLKHFENIPCVWKPPPTLDNGKYFTKFMKIIENEYGVKIENYWDLHKWSVENIEEFWAKIWDYAGVKYSKNFDKVIDLSIPMSSVPKWFIGARLNCAENILRHVNDNTAIVGIGEDREEKIYTYKDLYEEVKLYAAAFRKFGLKKGDKVACYMSNREEAIFAFLAANSVGAIWVGALPMLGAKAILDRLKPVNPRILISIDRFCYSGTEVDMLSRLTFLSQNLPSLEKIIIVPTKPGSTKKDITTITNSCFSNDFWNLGRNSNGTIPDMIFEQVPLSHPIIISHTSGTTGAAKAVVHDSGCLITSIKDQCLGGDFGRNVSLNMSPAGWASWFMATFQFISGSKAILFDGEPYLLTPTYFWDLIEKYQVTVFFVTPGTLDDLEKRGYVPTEKHTLKSLRVLFSGASVVKPQNYDFVYQKVKPEVIFSSMYGSTEVMGGSVTLHRTLPIYRGEIPCPSLGVDLQCLDEDGKPVIGEIGYLVIAKPLPSLPLGLFGDTDGKEYKEMYFSKFPDKFLLGDLAVINPITKGINVHGRSDEVHKPYGTRFGSSEIYNVVNVIPEIYDSIVVSQYSNHRTERVILFLKVKKDYEYNEELVEKVRSTIENELTIDYVPSLIFPAPELPYNMNGKKMEILVKKIVNNMPYNTDVVINKESLQYFMNVPPFID